jgi:hypothetical protein
VRHPKQISSLTYEAPSLDSGQAAKVLTVPESMIILTALGHGTFSHHSFFCFCGLQYSDHCRDASLWRLGACLELRRRHAFWRVYFCFWRVIHLAMQFCIEFLLELLCQPQCSEYVLYDTGIHSQYPLLHMFPCFHLMLCSYHAARIPSLLSEHSTGPQTNVAHV